MTLRKFFLLFTTVFLPVFTYSQQPNPDFERKEMIRSEAKRYQQMTRRQMSTAAAEDRIDVCYYRLEIAVTTSPQYVRGNVLMNARSVVDGLDSIRLDLMNVLSIDSVVVDGVSAAFTQHAENFDIRLPHTYSAGTLFSTRIYYKGVPGSSGFGSFEFASHGSPSVPWVWSLSEPYGAKDWWPCKDHPADKADSADIYVTCDSSFKAGSNGLLVSVQNNGDGTKTHHWHESYPISTYLISVALTNYSEFTNWFKYTAVDSMPVLNYVLPEHLASAQTNLARAPEMLGIYSNLFGLYPFAREKYGHAEFGWGGGMEHQTMTYLVSFSEYLVVHEMAHQWFGDMITCRTWPDIWLNEGFATYCEALYAEKKYSPLTYANRLQTYMNGAKSAVGSVHVTDSANVGYLFSGALVYDKGAAVLHMLRQVIGDSAFFHAMYNYANDPRFKYGTASTEDFRSVCEAEAGMSLGWFFDEWIYGEKYPHYSLSCKAYPGSGSTMVSVNVRQQTFTTNPVYFTMPVQVRFSGGGGDTTILFQNTAQNQIFTASLPFTPTSIQFDPRNSILKTVDTLEYISLPDTVEFDTIPVSVSATDTLTMTNYGARQIIVSSIVSDSPEFSVTPTAFSVNSGASKSFYTTFSPEGFGLRTGHLYVYNSSSTSPMVIAVQGYGVAASLMCVVSRDSLAFGHRPAGSSIAETLIVTNAGNGVLTVSSASVDKPAFSVDVTSFVLGPGMSRRIVVTFAPWQTGDCSGTLSFVHDGVNSPTAVYLSGWSDPLQISRHLQQRWNLVSVPVTLDDPRPSALFSSASSFAYRYEGSSYVAADSMQVGKGYWLKFPSAQVVTLSGVPHPTDTVAVAAGWNLIGGFHRPLLPSSISSVPGGVVTSEFFGYASGYTAADTLQPGAGYWVKVSQDAKLIFGAAEGAARPVAISRSLDVPPPPPEPAADAVPMVPAEYSLAQNYPNPFNPTTEIRYGLPVASVVRLVLVNSLGITVAVPVDGRQSAGYHTISIDLSGMPSGAYFYRLTAGTFTEVRKMVLMR